MIIEAGAAAALFLYGRQKTNVIVSAQAQEIAKKESFDQQTVAANRYAASQESATIKRGSALVGAALAGGPVGVALFMAQDIAQHPKEYATAVTGTVSGAGAIVGIGGGGPGITEGARSAAPGTIVNFFGMTFRKNTDGSLTRLS